MSAAAADADAALSFRARQHGGVPAVVAAHGSGGVSGSGGAHLFPLTDVGPPDTRRCILHFDVDAFYAQVEELRDPSLRDVPMARRGATRSLFQDALAVADTALARRRYIVVTCNYAARARGVAKLMLISAARAACPALRLVPGEDLTPYRRVSAAFLAVLSRFGATEKLGMDEAWVDVTAAAAAAAAAVAQPAPRFVGHVHAAAAAVAAHNRYRPMDLSAEGGGRDVALALPAAGGSDALLAAGSGIAAQVRAALRAELGLRASAGIAHNKLLSKLVSGLHKPDDQTALPAAQAASFLAPLPVRCLRGVGAAAETALAALGVHTVVQLATTPRAALVRALGDRTAATLFEAARGRDASPVVAKAAPRAVSVEDSFRGVSSLEGAEAVLRVLAPDLVARCAEERRREGRRPRTLTLRWRLAPPRQGAAAHRSSQRASASAPMPEELSSRGAAGVSTETAAAAVHRAAALLLRRHLRDPFVLTLLNIGATAFTAGGSNGRAGGTEAAAAAQYGQGAMPPGEAARAAAAAAEARRSYGRGAGALVSKRQERAMREGPPEARGAADDAVDAEERLFDDDDGDEYAYGGPPESADDVAAGAGGGSDGTWSDDDATALAQLTSGRHAPASSPPLPPPPPQPQQGLLRFFGSPALALPARNDAIDDAAGALRCAECGRALGDSGAATEHADWHLARALQRAEREPPPLPQGHKRKRGPLDAFVRRGGPP